MRDDEVRRVLLGTRRVAVVGASDKPARPCHGVTAFLIARGYEVVPVNPALAGRAIHGRPVVASSAQAGPLDIEPRGSPDMVDVFRRSSEAGAAVREAIGPGARTVWLQLGVVDEAATAEARAAGLRVVVDRCPAIEWPRPRPPGRLPATRPGEHAPRRGTYPLKQNRKRANWGAPCHPMGS